MIRGLLRLTADAMMFSTVLAGIKYASGVSPDVAKIGEPTIRTGVQQYLNAGDYLFGYAMTWAQHSSYFTNMAKANVGHTSAFAHDGSHLPQYGENYPSYPQGHPSYSQGHPSYPQGHPSYGQQTYGQAPATQW